MQDEKIDRLHFHYSGHGIFNQTVETNNSNHKVLHSETTFGPCIVGNNGDKSLCSILTIQSLMARANADIRTLTLDCCRDLDRPRSRHKVKLAKLPVISTEDWKRIATIYSTCLTQTARDRRSFSQELCKVIRSTKYGRVAFKQIAKLVNESWHKDGLTSQLCNIDLREVGDNWDKVYWPQ